MVFLEQGHVVEVQECYVSGGNRQICINNSSHRYLWPHNYPIKISDSSEELGRKEYLKDLVRNPPCPTGEEKNP